jgi:hypothetical protein
MKVSIKFCGGCNPKIDRVRLAEEIKNHLLVRDIGVVYNKPDAEFIVYVSGCSASCAMRYSGNDKPCVAIAGGSVDSLSVSEDCLVRIVIEKVGDYLGKLEKSL